ncbi:MAG: hypothetical protein ACE5RJ_02575 [Nitrosopumilaceae archaeon]
MVDPIIYDVKDLLLKEKGDLKVLERIKRAAENDEVISVYERDYVQDLAEKYLRPKPEPVEPIEDTGESVEEQEQTSETISEEPKQQQPIFEFKSKNPKTTKYAFAIGAIALAIILVVGVSQSEIDLPSQTVTPTSPTTTGLVISTDMSSYATGDIISVSGNSNPSLGNTVALSIENTDGDLIWYEDVKIKSSGAYSTLVIAGGSGWEKSGQYSLKAEHGNELKEISFSFKS